MSDKQPESSVLREFGVRSAELVTVTPLATVWRVQTASKERAALKVYHDSDMRNEAAGVDLLEVWNGNGAVTVYGRAEGVVLLEWLEGPSLGDLTRRGADDEANVRLAEVANTLHSRPVRCGSNFPRLTEWFEDLLSVRFGPRCPPTARENMERAKQLALQLLASEHNVGPLHGDLHHDNVRLGARGYTAFDAKGVLGEKTYELANAFRNPSTAREVVRNPERIKAIGQLWSDRFKVDLGRLHRWAAAKCALSIAWRSEGVLEDDGEFELLDMLLSTIPGDAYFNTDTPVGTRR